MKRRAKRDIGILLGVIIIIGSVAFFNSQISRYSLAREMENWRRDVEKQRAGEGIELLSWNLMKKTKGSLRSGGVYDDELLGVNGQHVNLIGFMVPELQYRDVTEFLLLPLPIECYFCQSPPPNEVMLVQLAEGQKAQIYREPVIINGRLTIEDGPEKKFFYRVVDARLGPGETSGDLTNRRLRQEHMIGPHEPIPDDQLLEPLPPITDSD